MTRMTRPIAAAVVAALFAALTIPNYGLAQSSTREQPSAASSQPQQGSSHRGENAASVGLQGYCPVCILDMKKWVKGDPQVQSAFDGHVYLFPGPEQKEKFESNPTKYAPVLGGDCIVAYAKMGKRVPGSIEHAAMQGGRLYLFSSEQAKQEFLANHQNFVNADLALGGNCAVCRVEMGKDMAGNPDYEVIYHGLRYRFPSEDQMKMFMANPEKYTATAASAGGAHPQGSGSGRR